MNSQLHFPSLMFTQRRLVELQEIEANIQTILISIQSMFFPCIEVLKHKLSITKNLMSQDENISTKEGLVELAATLEIQLQSLELDRLN